MMMHYCFRTCDAYHTLEFSINLLTMVSRGMAVMDAKGQRETAKLAADKILEEGNRLGWQFSDHIRTHDFVKDLNNETQFATETLVRELNGLKTSFHVALQNGKFAYLPPQMISTSRTTSYLGKTYLQPLKKLARI